MEREDYYSDMQEQPDDDDGRRVEEVDGATIEFGANDGDIVVDFGDPNDPDVNVFAGETGFAKNLALSMDAGELRTMAAELDEMVRADIDSRKESDELIEDALELLGLKDVADDRAPFEGASQINHPVLAEAIVDFHARAMDEFLPAAGPVKGTVMGHRTEEKLQQSARVQNWMNYQLTEKDGGYYNDTDQMLFKLPIYGTMFRRGFQDVLTGEPRLRAVPPTRCHVPYDARSIDDTPRVTYEYQMHENDLRRAMDKGAFRRVELIDATPEETDTSRAEDTADKRTVVRAEGDNVYTLFEVYIDRELPADIDEYQYGRDFALPYIITYCKELDDVLAIRRNWQKADRDCRRRIWITDYRFLPGLGFYGFGLLHIIGKAAKAGSAALRALLDAAAGSNMPGGFVTKEGASLGEGDLEFAPGVFKKLNISADDLSKALKELPVKEPSMGLFKLFEMLVEYVRSFSNKTQQIVSESSNTGPVGTTMALLEEAAKVMSGVHKRIHASARKEFKILHTLNGELMTVQQYDYDVQGETRYVLKEDFDSEVDVIPVSDPNIWSSTQRIAQAEATLRVVKEDPRGIFDDEEVIEAYRRLFQALRVPEIEKLLRSKKVKRLDPISENQLIQTGKAVQAFPEQDHAAHMAVHQHYLATVQGGGDKEMIERLTPVMKAHIVEHMALDYRNKLALALSQAGIQLPPFDQNGQEHQELPVEFETQIARAAAAMAPQAIPAPPPPDQGPTPEQIEAQAKAKREDEDAAAERRRKDEAAVADEKRKDVKLAGDLKRENVKAAAKSTQDSAGVIANLLNKFRGGKNDNGKS